MIAKVLLGFRDHSPEPFVGQGFTGDVVVQDILDGDGIRIVTEDLRLVAERLHQKPVAHHLVIRKACRKQDVRKTLVVQCDVEDKLLWRYIKVRTAVPRPAKKKVGGKYVKYTLYPQLGEKARNNGNVVYSLDFEVTPHQLRHTYITNLIAAGVDPKTVQYLAGHENSKITMDIYAKVKYNKPEEVVKALEGAFARGGPAQGHGAELPSPRGGARRRPAGQRAGSRGSPLGRYNA